MLCGICSALARWRRSPLLNLRVGGSIPLWADWALTQMVHGVFFFYKFFLSSEMTSCNCNDIMTSVSKSETILVFEIGPALKIANFFAKFSAIFFEINFAKIFADENLHKNLQEFLHFKLHFKLYFKLQKFLHIFLHSILHIFFVNQPYKINDYLIWGWSIWF